jgi:hypothetical protein
LIIRSFSSFSFEDFVTIPDEQSEGMIMFAVKNNDFQSYLILCANNIFPCIFLNKLLYSFIDIENVEMNGLPERIAGELDGSVPEIVAEDSNGNNLYV